MKTVARDAHDALGAVTACGCILFCGALVTSPFLTESVSPVSDRDCSVSWFHACVDGGEMRGCGTCMVVEGSDTAHVAHVWRLAL
jgi:hypothetical protein